MESIIDTLKELGVGVPEVFLPVPGLDLRSWAVVACDQYSSEKEYWNRIDAEVGTKPSTLRLIYPECFLEEKDKAERIESIQSTMREYLDRGFLQSPGPGFVLVERITPYEKEPRIGLLACLDLEKYVFGKDSRSLIRPTEGTIVERLPPRMAIRRGAPLELPHIMVLMDDPGRSVVEPLYQRRNYRRKLYDFDLAAGSGHLRAWLVDDEEDMERVAKALSVLADPEAFRNRHGVEDVLLFAVGDGNHSLATAKAVWEEIKASLAGRPGSESLIENHPARFALVELLNIYDKGLPFHPIHRVLFNVDEKDFLDAARGSGAAVTRLPDAAAAFAACDSPADSGQDARAEHKIAFTGTRGSGLLVFSHPASRLAAGTIQEILDAYLKTHPETGIDYIHGSGSLETLASQPGNLGLYLPAVDKASFFATVVRDGAMPRKTFSMGEAPEKRFYMEARRITPSKT